MPENLIPREGHVHHSEESEVGSWIFVALLALSLSAGTLERAARRVLAFRSGQEAGPGSAAPEPGPATDVTLAVANMTCAHCAENVTRILREALPDVRAEINLAARRVVLRQCGARAEVAIERLRAAGYAAEPSAR